MKIMPLEAAEGFPAQGLRHRLIQEGGYRSWCEVTAEPQTAAEVAAAGVLSVNETRSSQGSKMATRNAASVFACAVAEEKGAEFQALQLGWVVVIVLPRKANGVAVYIQGSPTQVPPKL